MNTRLLTHTYIYLDASLRWHMYRLTSQQPPSPIYNATNLCCRYYVHFATTYANKYSKRQVYQPRNRYYINIRIQTAQQTFSVLYCARRLPTTLFFFSFKDEFRRQFEHEVRILTGYLLRVCILRTLPLGIKIGLFESASGHTCRLFIFRVIT